MTTGNRSLVFIALEAGDGMPERLSVLASVQSVQDDLANVQVRTVSAPTTAVRA